MKSGRLWGLMLAAILIAGAGLAVHWYFKPAQRPGWVADYVPTDPAAEVILYRWKDEAGQWVLSSEPPPAGVEYEEVSYRHDTNVLPATQTEDD
ncbi:MAG: DUF4124 domain-containing protein [Xanthomonadales bacterium]|nr:DUF4124 domain-containing protein [Xanthomonadales bacterium]